MSVYQIVEYKWQVNKGKVNRFLLSFLYYLKCARGVFRTQPNIYDGAFTKVVNSNFRKKAPP